jgi:hypothetical protein
MKPSKPEREIIIEPLVEPVPSKPEPEREPVEPKPSPEKEPAKPEKTPA